MLKIEIKTDTAAFAAAPCDECARILRGVVERVERGRCDGLLYDHDGNKVGFWELEDEED